MISNRVFFRTLATAASLSLMSGHSIGQDNQSLEALLSNIQTLSAEVLQLIIESDGGVLEESTIQMYLKRPNGFYWETLEPFPELVVTNGSTLWNYQPDLEQVVLEDWDSTQSELAAQLLSGETETLSDEYEVRQQQQLEAGLEAFDLTPLANDSVYDAITISFNDHEISSIRIANKNGQRTVWEFQAVQRNDPLDDSLFVFDIPEDIEVIDNSSGD